MKAFFAIGRDNEIMKKRDLGDMLFISRNLIVTIADPPIKNEAIKLFEEVVIFGYFFLFLF